jgi:stage IV sporulation protein FB
MLRFTFLRIPVAVHWTFGLVALFVLGQLDVVEVVGWMVGVFAAVLLHEMGHALTARRFGAGPVTITLFALGGVTMYPSAVPMSPGRRFLISGAGSAVGITLGGAVWFAERAGALDGLFPFARAAAYAFMIAGLLWGVLNWLPILPLDGGNMAWSALELVSPRHALRVAKGLTVVTAAAVAFVAVRLDNLFGAFFVAFIAMQGLRIPERGEAPSPPRPRPGSDDSLLSIFDQPPDDE